MPAITLARRRRASRSNLSPALRVLGRTGLTARGVLYILIGWVAILVALHHSSQQANQQGALQLLAGQPFGRVSLWVLAFGFVAYALWRVSDACFGITGGTESIFSRLKPLGPAVIYASFAYLTFKVIFGTEGSQTHQQQDVTATVMHHPAGRWIVGIVGLAVVVVGLVLASEGIRRKFLEHLQTGQMSPRARRVVELLGVIGITARGLVIAIAGGLVVDSAVTYQSSQSGGIDKALLTLRDQPYGVVLMLAAALGLLIFGAYGLCEARWRQVG